MPRAHIVVESPIVQSTRVVQMRGLFDVQHDVKTCHEWDIDLHELDERDWQIGLVCGPSGSGKSTIAKHFWSDSLMLNMQWSHEQSVLDAFPETMSIKEIVSLLSAVGFSSPPSWVKPYHVLSTGEQFRARMALLLAQHQSLMVVDEFTSVVDRTVAKTCSAALSRAIRRRKGRFIGVTCHDDVEAWLTPDWVYRTDEQKLYWRHLQRPRITLELERTHATCWNVFRAHHYLDASLNTSSLCFVAYWQDRAVAFVAVLSFPGSGWRIHRWVCLPDYQGVGIGGALVDFIASVFRVTRKRVLITSSHPAVVTSLAKSLSWHMMRAPALRRGGGTTIRSIRQSFATDRLTAGFTYVGPRASRKQLRVLMPEWAARLYRVGNTH